MNATLQGAYFMIAARSVGLDCGPMGGFNAETLDQAFFPNGKTKSIFLCCIGHGDSTQIFSRSPRLSFDKACEII
jgi:3-hydroxypropanoate dehydrogenase